MRWHIAGISSSAVSPRLILSAIRTLENRPIYNPSCSFIGNHLDEPAQHRQRASSTSSAYAPMRALWETLAPGLMDGPGQWCLGSLGL